MVAEVRPLVQIRAANFPTDKEIVSRLFLAYAQSLPIKLDFQGFEEELVGLPGKYASERGGAVYLAYAHNMNSEEDVVGIVALRRFQTTNAIPTCELKRLYLTPASRGLGVSKLLMDVVLDKARDLGYEEMLLDTLSSMTPAMRLYEKYGFVEIGSYYESVESAVFYKLVLGDGRRMNE
jgi:GNAT superfamily N-acetyltransferase